MAIDREPLRGLAVSDHLMKGNGTVRLIGFAPDLIPLIMAGEKTLTYRIGSKYADIVPGEMILAYDSSSGKVRVTLAVVSVCFVPFRNLSLCSIGHEPYESRKHMRDTFATYYRRKILPDEITTVIEFHTMPEMGDEQS